MKPPLFTTWTFKGRRFLAFRNGNGEVSVTDEDGGNYGAWMTAERFQKRQRRGDELAQPMPGTYFAFLEGRLVHENR